MECNLFLPILLTVRRGQKPICENQAHYIKQHRRMIEICSGMNKADKKAKS